MSDPFDSADYFDACDSELINHMCPEDAIDEFANWNEWYDDRRPITVTAYVEDWENPTLDHLEESVPLREVGKRTYSVAEVLEIVGEP